MFSFIFFTFGKNSGGLYYFLLFWEGQYLTCMLYNLKQLKSLKIWIATGKSVLGLFFVFVSYLNGMKI